MKKAIIKQPFSIVQWHGTDYPFYESDAEENAHKTGDTVLVVHEAQSNPMGRMFVIFNERVNDSAVVAESYLEFVND